MNIEPEDIQVEDSLELPDESELIDFDLEEDLGDSAAELDDASGDAAADGNEAGSDLNGALDMSDAALDDASADDEGTDDAGASDEDAEDAAPQTSAPGELTEEELAALDAEIAAQLDAEEAGTDVKDEWYFIHSYSGMENKVKKNLEHRSESMGMTDRILQVVVPTETEIEIRNGVRKEVEKRVFPGYVLVNMLLDEDSWYVVRNTPGVTGFVGMGNKPTPLNESEVAKIMERLEADEPRIKVNFEIGEHVRITGGPFAEFNGTVEEIYADKGKAKVMVSFFNRETPVEVDFVQIERDVQ